MNIKREKVTMILMGELFPLLHQHYKEVSHFQHIPLEPDYDKYVDLEIDGALRAYVARDSANGIIGYAVFFVRHNIHYSGSLQAVQDILYLDPKFRGEGLGMAMIAYCDEQLKEEGVDVVYHHVKVALDFSPLLKKLGYEHIENIYGRRL